VKVFNAVIIAFKAEIEAAKIKEVMQEFGDIDLIARGFA
jgi:hypothetical protein